MKNKHTSDAVQFLVIALLIVVFQVSCTVMDSRIHGITLAAAASKDTETGVAAIQAIASIQEPKALVQFGGQQNFYYPDGRALWTINNEKSFTDGNRTLNSLGTATILGFAGVAKAKSADAAATAQAATNAQEATKAAKIAADAKAVEAANALKLKELEMSEVPVP